MSKSETAVDMMKTVAAIAALMGVPCLMALGLVRVVQYESLEQRLESLEDKFGDWGTCAECYAEEWCILCGSEVEEDE